MSTGMTGELKPVTILSIAGGAIPELFERELAKVIGNIDDANTEATAKRSITIEITLTADENREALAAQVKVNSKLVGLKPQYSTVFVVRDPRTGQLAAFGPEFKQPDLPFDRGGKVADINAKRE